MEYINVNKSIRITRTLSYKEALEIGVKRFLLERFYSIIYLGFLLILVYIGISLDIPMVILALLFIGEHKTSKIGQN
ncbi:hypothetical protein HY404_01830 [Candidatus Microgenomates bacterium]|nr:hypothetical protein [Candidatus Microgenomates bacterium]